MEGKNIKIMSYNCQGLHMKEKQGDIFDYLNSKDLNIYCLQDTHFIEQDEVLIKKTNGKAIVFSIHLLQIKEKLLYCLKIILTIKYTKLKKDGDGNLVGLDLNIEDKRFTLINVYGPNIDTPCFYDKLTEIIDFFGNQLCIICGDFNLVQNFNLDTHNYININNPRSREKILEIKEYKNLVDPFREINKGLHGEGKTLLNNLD